jgi:ubiquinol-cytochrome c reductase cytochrome b subunit
LTDWLDHRTGCRKLVAALLLEEIPGGAKWRYVWGSCLAFVFGVQLVTGLLLLTAYSPGDSTAWSSVWFIQYQMDFGWLIRGLHHFGSQTMVVLLGVHMLQVVIAGAHLPPREVNWWLGLGLMGVVLALSLTGYLLPWDQKGYWATQVATNIAGSLPGIGAFVQKVIVGGPEYGHHTLTRFFALHVGVLPALLIVLLVAHVAVFRRHGVTAPKGAEGEGWFWPDQAFRDMLVSLIIFGIMLALVLHGHGQPTTPAENKWSYDYWAHAGRDGKGANLDAPADPSHSYPARPEWYFLFLFQLLKYFPGSQEIIGTVVVPNAVGVLLFLLPLFGYGRMRPLGHILGVIVVVGLLTGAAMLTVLALAEDTVLLLPRATLTQVALRLLPLIGGVLLVLLALLAILPRGASRSLVGVLGWAAVLVLAAAAGAAIYTSMETDARYLAHLRGGGSPESFDGVAIPKPVVEWVQKDLSSMNEERQKQEEDLTDKARKFQDEQDAASKTARRAVAAAGAGIPAAGGLYMMKHDPVTWGPRLFEQNCAACHTHGSDFKVEKPTAPDLEGFGSEEWIYRLLSNPGRKELFGRTKLTTMDGAIKDEFPMISMPPEEQAKLNGDAQKALEEEKKDLQALARWLAAHPRTDSPDKDADWFKEGVALFEKHNCQTCHTYEGLPKGGKRGPDLTGYGDADWLRKMIMMPSHPSRYGVRNTMPAFRDRQGPTAAVTKEEAAWLKELLVSQITDEGPKAEKMKQQIEDASRLMHLGDVDRELIIRWLLKDPSVVFGGDAIVPSPRKR